MCSFFFHLNLLPPYLLRSQGDNENETSLLLQPSFFTASPILQKFESQWRQAIKGLKRWALYRKWSLSWQTYKNCVKLLWYYLNNVHIWTLHTGSYRNYTHLFYVDPHCITKTILKMKMEFNKRWNSGPNFFLLAI